MTDAMNRMLRKIPAWPIYVGSMAYFGWMFWLGLTGGLGAEPVKALEHALGEAALYMLLTGLLVTPLRRLAGLNLIKFRRAIGLSCFFFLTAHLLVWAVLDVQAFDRVWADIVKRPYITVGMAAFVLLIPLAVTSNNLSVRKLGPVWRKLHRLTYPAAILGGVHYVMQAKGFQLQPIVFMAVILVLLVLRFRFSRPFRQA